MRIHRRWNNHLRASARGAHRRGADHHDEWLVRLVVPDPTIAGDADWDQKIVALSRDLAFRLVAKGINVTLDEGSRAEDERAEMRRRIEESGAEAVLVYLDTPTETNRELIARRSADPPQDSFRIGGDLLDHYLPIWQPPSDDEGYVLANEIGLGRTTSCRKLPITRQQSRGSDTNFDCPALI